MARRQRAGKPHRVRVETNIYRETSGALSVRSSGTHVTIQSADIEEARRVRDEMLAAQGRPLKGAGATARDLSAVERGIRVNASGRYVVQIGGTKNRHTEWAPKGATLDEARALRDRLYEARKINPRKVAPRPQTRGGVVDYLDAARRGLESAKIELEAQLSRVNTALAAISDDEEDAAAEYRQPGALAHTLSQEIRERLERPIPIPAAAAPSAGRNGDGDERNVLGKRDYQRVQTALPALLDEDEGTKTGDLRSQLATLLDLPNLTGAQVTTSLKKLEERGMTRRESNFGQNSTTRWFRQPESPVPSSQGELPTAEAAQ